MKEIIGKLFSIENLGFLKINFWFGLLLSLLFIDTYLFVFKLSDTIVLENVKCENITSLLKYSDLITIAFSMFLFTLVVKCGYITSGILFTLAACSWHRYNIKETNNSIEVRRFKDYALETKNDQIYKEVEQFQKTYKNRKKNYQAFFAFIILFALNVFCQGSMSIVINKLNCNKWCVLLLCFGLVILNAWYNLKNEINDKMYISASLKRKIELYYIKSNEA